ncbi:Pls/PosA family non-ribosomal peptide synthetase [Streptomyces sp. NPDC046985]|uniref:Pls/PosA family non-ribosomal peptide synthetase n=1 Tax=Streptomyces sp. NPDC046985 TaxID=3155377 RepID=UPI0033E72A1D
MVEKSADILMPGPDETAGVPREESNPAAMDAERELAVILAQVVKAENVPSGSHFFMDLGANSLVMAQFCARVRKRPDLPSVSMKDIYRHPTIRDLAAALVVAAPAGTSPDAAAPAASGPAAPTAPAVPAAPPRTAPYFLCGALQSLIFLGYSFLMGMAAARAYEWISTGSGFFGVYARSFVCGGAAFIALCLVPVAAKWILVGRWKAQEFPVWGLSYLRLWFVKSLLHANPMVLFVGNPLYVMYLRALGARIGKDVTILSKSVPVCTDLLTIGSGTVIRKDSFFLGYRAHAGRIQTGRITLGRDVFIGEKTVLDIDTAMGDDSQLGHSSALYRGQRIPAGERRHGSPAQPTEVDYARVPAARCGTLRRACFALSSLLQLFFVYAPLAVGGTYLVFAEVPALSGRLDPRARTGTAVDFVGDTLLLGTVLFAASLMLGLFTVCVVPRLLRPLLKPDRVYPLYGLHYAAHRMTAALTNSVFFTWLFGDSSYIVPYLRAIGYDLSEVEQTGSNFGTEVHHENPFLVTVGTGTMVADGLSVLNAEFSSTSFRTSRASIGAGNFIGNNIAYPVGARTGDDCLLATKVMVPLDGEIRQGVGLLGSPCFEIPRSVERDTSFDHMRTGEELRRNLAAKNRSNLRTIALHVGLRWMNSLLLTAVGLASVALYGTLGHVVIAGYLALTLALNALFFVLVERALGSFRRLSPRLCSIYDPYFWWHERLWKVPDRYLEVFNGTPYKSLIWRLLGVRIGRRVFDDGCYISERTLTEIGDDCTLNAASKIQCHSQEDGTFKSDRTTLGADVTLGVGSHVHYGVTIGDRAVLAPDSFLMKGEEVPANAEWGGNPAAPTAN